MRKNKVVFIQLPFPSTGKPNKLLKSYYKYYSLRYREILTDYFIPVDELWELPTQWAFLSGNFRHYNQLFLELSKQDCELGELLYEITDKSVPEDILLFSL